MRLFCVLWLFAAGNGVAAVDDSIFRVQHKVTDWIQRAELYFRNPTQNPRAWLLLCPGRNGNGEGLLKDEKWAAFARENNLFMCGVSYASTRKDDLLGRYTEVQKGSGNEILRAMDARTSKPLPILVVGFSAGARFTTNWMAWKPERVLAWSAQAVGNWPNPPEHQSPPGIVASGGYDAGSWFASLQYFQASRKVGKKVIWLSLDKVSHTRSIVLDDYTRQFFLHYLNPKTEAAYWYDIDSKKDLSLQEVEDNPIFATWFPSLSLRDKWISIHTP